MKKVTRAQAFRVGNKLGVDFEVLDLDTLRQGMNVELEHRNVTHANLEMTAKIALAHLLEFPNYYEELEKMEAKLKRQWRGKRKPDLFL